MNDPTASAGAAFRCAAAMRVAGYTADGVDQLLGMVASAALHREQTLPARQVLASATEPLARLIELFILKQPIAETDLGATLPTSALDWLIGVGVLERSGGQLHANLELRPYLDGYVVSDFGEAVTGGPLPEDHVLGVGGASLTLAGATVGQTVSTTLDLGTGCGVQAIHAARRSTHVVATDIDQRALHCASITLALNGLEQRVELRRGSLFEPIAGQRFDLIVSNPPFVATPRPPGVPRYTYRDGGQVGDGVACSVVTGVGDHLNPGGIAQLLGNWELRDGQTTADVLTPWLSESLDAWVIQRDELDPAQYAELWIGDGGLRHGGEFQRLYAAWLDDFASRGVTAIGMGLITLRRPVAGSATLRRFEEIAHPITSVGEAIGRGLVVHDLLQSADPMQLTFTVATDVTEERYHWPGAEDPTVIQLRQGGGLRRVRQLSSATAAVVGACDGSLPVRVICAAVAQLTDRSEEAVLAEVVEPLRVLVQEGFLCPA